jgi:hypothetical protein
MMGESSMVKQKEEVILEPYDGKKGTKKFLSSSIEGDVIIFEDGGVVPKKYLYDIRMLRVRGNGAKKKLSNGKTLHIVSFYEGENIGKTVVKITDV